MQTFGPDLSIDFRPATGVTRAAQAVPEELTNIAIAFATSPKTPSNVLEGLAEISDKVVLEHLATNPSTPKTVLEQLVTHAEPDVRAAVAENKNTPMACIWMLVKDQDPNVRFALAENHQLCSEMLSVLADDDNPYVGCRAQRTLARVESEIQSRLAAQEDWRNFRQQQLSKRMAQIEDLSSGTPMSALTKLMNGLRRYARAI
jgi:hypothetical protein